MLINIISIISHTSAAQCYELVWSEEFDYEGLPDSSVWTMEEGGGGWGNNELQYYTKNDLDNAIVADGKLTIKVLEESYGGRDYTSARLITLGKVNFRYGKVEVSIRLPYGQGIWPAFWMMGEKITRVGWPACGEIDILELVGGPDSDNVVHGTAHWDNNGSHAMYGGSTTLPEGIFADTFHVFSIEWTPEVIRWFLDGEQYHVIDITPAELGEFHDAFFLLLNVAVGGNWPGSPDGTTVFPQVMEVDYARVYQSGKEPEIRGDSSVIIQSTGYRYSLPYSGQFEYEWTVPAGAGLVSGQGTNEIVVDWGCSSGPIQCDLTGLCGSYALSKDVQAGIEIHGPMFIAPNDTNILFTASSITETDYNWVLPDDANILSGQGTDSIYVDWGTRYDTVKVSVENDCGLQWLALPVRKTGQYPYPDPDILHAIPGTIRAVDYDYGGDGVAYHDITAGNSGNGPRQEEAVDTEYGDDGSPNVGWIDSGEWLEYSIQVDSASFYIVDIRVATNNSSGGPFSVEVNGRTVLDNIGVDFTGGWADFTDIRAGIAYLTEADTVLSLNFRTGGFNVSTMTFTPTESSNTQDNSFAKTISVYPNPFGDLIEIRSGQELNSLEILDISGKRLKIRKQIEDTRLQLDLGELSPGLYILRVSHKNGAWENHKLIKSGR